MAGTDWFATRELHDGVWVIAEPFHVNSFLVEGTESRVHLDTGLGVADIRAAGDALSGRRPWVANTHHHYDHIGGNGLFDEVAIHELGAELVAEPQTEFLQGYREWARGMYERWEAYRAADEDYFSMLDDVGSLRTFPPGFDLSAWDVPASKPTRIFVDGDVLDLGGRRLRVIHTPGHSIDSACFLDEEHGLLFAGDTVNSGPILADDPTASVEDFARSTRRLADELMGSARAVYMAHGARFQAEPRYLLDVADGFEAVVDGTVPLRTVDDAFSGHVRVARFARFSIVVPPDSGR